MKTGINMNRFISQHDDALWRNGFHMTFDNGVTISVQFGKHNYSDGGKTTAEVAVWDEAGNWYIADDAQQDLIKVEEGSDVMGHCTPDVVAWIMDKARKI